MSELGIGSAGDDQSLTPSWLERVVEACDDFEVAWRDGLKPRIEDYLNGHADPRLRSAFLYSLLAVELELRSRFGEFLVLQDYLERFPDDAALVRRVFETARISESSTRSGLDTTADELRDTTLTVLSGELEGEIRQSGPLPKAGENEPEDEALPRPLGRFNLLRLLGVGMFGKVYLAWDDKLGREVAIKIPRRGVIESPATAEASLAEAKHAAQLRHPAIVTVFDVVTLEDGTVFVVMEYIEGSTLRQMLKNGPLAPGWAAGLIVQVADALHYAHTKKFVHRDIKPANILIDRLGQPHVADFGLAVHQTTQPGRSGELAGTVPYMAPEQVRAEAHRLDGRTDVWALGVILYELLTRGRPFTGHDRERVFEEIVYSEAKPPRQLNGAVPRELERICLKCLSKRMTDRYQTAADLADDLRDWLATRTIVDDSSARRPRPAPLTRVVPKGPRSFSPEDESFFLELMPGPRDRDGLPEIVRFWKTRIEATGRETAFAVGLIFGPSGCGKSSLVHAGIIPKLDNDSVLTVAVAAGASSQETEAELLRRLRHRCPELARNEEIDLLEALRRLRQGQGLPAGKKLLIVLDQFEQYLQSCPVLELAPLVEALRQCDGEHVQCLLLVRDDFWIALTRFLRLLEIDLSSDRNMTAVDLFDRRHARAVLAAFGRGYGALPEDPEALTYEQRKFLDQAIEGLAEGDGIICVRLALFAEMFKDRPWTPTSLKELGGIQGVGVAFLKATIGPEARHPVLSLHGEAARKILESLLPPAGSPLKGRMRSYAELLADSGYHEREGEFRELLRVLDSELRLLTPAEEHAAAAGPSATVEAESQGPLPTRDASKAFYQLTHDYLVHSIRDWVEGMKGETKRGRALLRLAGLTTLWSSRPEPRNLPSFLEWLSIRGHTRPREWSPASRTMMAAASRRLAIRLGAAVVAMALLGLGGWELFDEHRRQAEKAGESARRETLVTSLDTVRVERIPVLLDELRPIREVLRDQLGKKRDSVEPTSEARLAISLVYLPDNPDEVDFLVERLRAADAEELAVIRDELNRHQPEAAKRACWRVVRDPASKNDQRLRAAGALAVLDPENDEWRDQARDVAAAMIQETPAHHWTALFRPVGSKLTDPLLTIYNDEKAPLDKRVLAGIALAAYFSTDGDLDAADRLVELVMSANPQQFAFVFPKLRDLIDPHRVAASKRLTGEPKGELDDQASVKRQEVAVKRLSQELDKEAQRKWNDVELKNAPRPEPAIIEQLAKAQGICSDRFAFCQTLPLEDFHRLASDLQPCGYRPSCARPYTADGKVLVAAAWTRDGLGWAFKQDLTAREVEQANQEYRAEWDKQDKGFLPVDIACYVPPRGAGSQPRYAALWVAAQREPDGRLTSLEFMDAKMYVGAAGESEHEMAYKDLNDARFVPRTNLKRVDRNGTWYSSVRWKLQDPPRDRDTWNEESWKRVEEVVNRPLDLALMAIDVRFSSIEDHGGIAYATTWWSGVGFESRVLKELSPDEHVKRCAELERDNFRPMGISAIEVPAKVGEQAQSRIVTASVWRRPLVAEDDKDRLAERKAVAAISLYLLGKPDFLKDGLGQAADPRLRSELIERLTTFEVDIQELVPHLDGCQPSEASLRRALLLVLASVPNEKVPAELREKLKTRLGELYRNDPDRGIHSAAELVLRNWKLGDVLKTELDALRRQAKPIRRLDSDGRAALAGKEWFVTPGGQTMVVLHGPIQFMMGSPGGEPSRDHCQEPLRPRTIDRTIAVETKEVTVAQFLDYFPNHTNHFDLGRECPVNNVTWYQVLKYCNKRSIDEKLEPCYPEEVGPNMVLDPGLLRKNGYRLPTEVEAEYISRAGTNTTWYFGHSKSLVSRYGWTVYNSETQVHPVVHPVGRLLPNDFGLFDTVGNVFEWCQDRYYPDRPGLCDELQVALPRSPHIGKVGLTEFFGLGLQTLIDTLAEVPEPDIVEDEQPRVMRGGSCYYIPMHARSALRDKNRVINPQVYLGFRVVRTLPVSPPPKSD